MTKSCAGTMYYRQTLYITQDT